MRRPFRAALAVGLLIPLLLPAEPSEAATRRRHARPPAAKTRRRKPAPPAPAPAPAPVPQKKHKHGPHAAPRIRRVRVIRKDIFDVRVPAENKGLFRMMNALHVSTKESAVRGQLLLKEGDLYNTDLARESERALRNILQLRNVKVAPVPVNDRTVDLFVTTQETWTTEPVLSFSGVGSNLNLKAGLRERNLMGYGKNASYFYRKTDGVISRTYSYDDPLFLNQRLTFSGKYQDVDDGSIRALAISKPFAASITPFSMGANYVDDTHDVKELDNLGAELDTLRSSARVFGADLSASAGSTTRRVHRPRLGYKREQDRITRLSTGKRETDDLYHIFRLGHFEQKVDFLTVNHIDNYDRDEDFNMGPTLDLEGGASRRKWTPAARNANFFTGALDMGMRQGPSQFSLFSAKGAGKFQEKEWRGATAQTDFFYYNRFQPRQTLACHLGWAGIANPGPADGIKLGGDTGLRGYKLNQFSGNKKLLANVEDRFFVVDDVVRFMSLGAVVFGDAGYVWAPGKDVRMKDVRSDVGAGLRVYLTRTSVGHVLRFDLAYALKRVGAQSRLVFTFGTSHAFGLTP